MHNISAFVCDWNNTLKPQLVVYRGKLKRNLNPGLPRHDSLDDDNPCRRLSHHVQNTFSRKAVWQYCLICVCVCFFFCSRGIKGGIGLCENDVLINYKKFCLTVFKPAIRVEHIGKLRNTWLSVRSHDVKEVCWVWCTFLSVWLLEPDFYQYTSSAFIYSCLLFILHYLFCTHILF